MTTIQLKSDFSFFFAVVSLEMNHAVRINLGQQQLRYLPLSTSVRPFIYAAKDIESFSQVSLASSVTVNSSQTENENLSSDFGEKKGSSKEASPTDRRTSKSTEVIKPKNSCPDKLEDIDLESIPNEAELLTFGLDRLKHALQVRGLKCGGTCRIKEIIC